MDTDAIVRGGRLTDYCDGRRLDVQARVRLFLNFLNVLRGVEHAHQKGVLHAGYRGDAGRLRDALRLLEAPEVFQVRARLRESALRLGLALRVSDIVGAS